MWNKLPNSVSPEIRYLRKWYSHVTATKYSMPASNISICTTDSRMSRLTVSIQDKHESA